MVKGEIARYKQFLLFPQSFQKACFPGASKGVIVWEWLLKQKVVWIPSSDIFFLRIDEGYLDTGFMPVLHLIIVLTD